MSQQISRKTLGLKPVAIYENKTEPCKNCAKHFDEHFKQLNSTIQNLQAFLYDYNSLFVEMIINQNDVIMKTMSEHKVLIKRILFQETTINNLCSTFPLKSIDGLIEINKNINDTNRNDYINTMKTLLKGRLPKKLTEIMSTDLCMDINLDGVHGKKRLKDFAAFYDALTDACRALGSQDVETELRNALKIIKKRCIHAKCIKNKSTNLKN